MNSRLGTSINIRIPTYSALRSELRYPRDHVWRVEFEENEVKINIIESPNEARTQTHDQFPYCVASKVVDLVG